LTRQAIIELTLKTTALTVAVIALYLQDLTLVFKDALTNEATSYILIIPIIFAYLIYRKRKMLTATATGIAQNQPKNTKYYTLPAGILLCTIATMIYWYGSYTFTPIEYHLFTLPIFTAGLTLILFNPQTLRQALFPIAFLTFLMPPPSEMFYNIGAALSVSSSEASTAIAQFFRIPATLTAEYGTPTIQITRPDTTTMNFTVDIACSGIYSLIGFLVFAVFMAYIVRDKPTKKAAVFLIGLPLIYLLNVTRIVTIVAIGYTNGEQLALDLFHLFGGWVLIFIGTLLLLAISEKLLKTDLFNSKNRTTCPTCTTNNPTETRSYCADCGRILKHTPTNFSAKDLTKIIAAITIILLLLWIQMPVFANTMTPAPLMVNTPDGLQGNNILFPQIDGYTTQFLYRDTGFENKSGQDFSLIFLLNPNQQGLAVIWIGLELASTMTPLHRWETCLVTWPQARGYQVKVTQLDLRDTQILENPPIIARYFAFQTLRDNQTQLVLYWYETCAFTINNETQQKHAKLSLITYPETPQNVSMSESQLLPIAEAIANHWQPIKTWALISILISKHGLDLAITATTILAILVALCLIELRKQTKTSLNAYGKLKTDDQQLVRAVREAQETKLPTLEMIRETYEKNSSKKLTGQQLEQRLTELQKVGTVNKTLSNNRDEPVIIWKA
jgi:exosortase/archaeosortase family protein